MQACRSSSGFAITWINQVTQTHKSAYVEGPVPLHMPKSQPGSDFPDPVTPYTLHPPFDEDMLPAQAVQEPQTPAEWYPRAACLNLIVV